MPSELRLFVGPLFGHSSTPARRTQTTFARSYALSVFVGATVAPLTVFLDRLA